MKQLTLSVLLFLVGYIAFGQEEDFFKKQDLQKMKSDIEKQIPAYKQKLSKRYLNADETEFSLDTFRIEQIFLSMSSYIPSSTNDPFVEAVVTKRDAYDKLLNKYYNKLLKVFKPEDRPALIKAEKAWIAFRDAEDELVGNVLTKSEYNEDRALKKMDPIFNTADVVKKRAIDIFNYYNGISN
jgi:hypothetical protein